MKNVIILGSGGNIAKRIIDMLVKKDDINLTLFLRDKSRLRDRDVSGSRIPTPTRWTTRRPERANRNRAP
ncbi:MAG: hypothetical protein ABW208_24730 [Pyrinomonadaceae bacterium]